ncbi:MAG: hypothetical protein WCO86_05780, partial [Planctomycetota bacterium]
MAFRCVLIWSILRFGSACLGQGLRIPTHIHDLAKGAAPGLTVSSSQSLCHNGRLYDNIDAAAEVVHRIIADHAVAGRPPVVEVDPAGLVGRSIPADDADGDQATVVAPHSRRRLVFRLVARVRRAA